MKPVQQKQAEKKAAHTPGRGVDGMPLLPDGSECAWDGWHYRDEAGLKVRQKRCPGLEGNCPVVCLRIAAPDLLEAAKLALEACEGMRKHEGKKPHYERNLRAAIAKAEGGR